MHLDQLTVVLLLAVMMVIIAHSLLVLWRVYSLPKATLEHPEYD